MSKPKQLANEWNDVTMPILFSQLFPKEYDAIEKKVSDLNDKGLSIVIGHLAFYIKPLIKDLLKYLNVREIYDGIGIIVEYMLGGSEARIKRDDVMDMNKYLPKKMLSNENKTILLDTTVDNISNRRKKDDASSNYKDDINIIEAVKKIYKKAEADKNKKPTRAELDDPLSVLDPISKSKVEKQLSKLSLPDSKSLAKQILAKQELDQQYAEALLDPTSLISRMKRAEQKSKEKVKNMTTSEIKIVLERFGESKQSLKNKSRETLANKLEGYYYNVMLEPTPHPEYPEEDEEISPTRFSTTINQTKPIRRSSKKPDTFGIAELATESRIINPQINNIYENHINISPEYNISNMESKKQLAQAKKQLTKANREISKWTKLMANMDNLLDKRKTLNGKIKYVQGLIKKLSEANALVQMTVENFIQHKEHFTKYKFHLDKVLASLIDGQPITTRKQKKMSLKKYIRTINYLLKRGGYKIEVVKTIDNSENISILAFCLQLIFPDILNYNIYKLTDDQIKYILETIKKYITTISQEEYQNIISVLDINEVTRTFTTKPSQSKLPILEDVTDIQTAYGYVPLSGTSDEDELHEEDEPIVTMKDTIHYEKPSTKRVSKLVPYLKEEQDPTLRTLDFYDTVEALQKPPQKKRIPQYVPPENYTEQEDVYSSYKTYGEYNNRELVFANATEYMSDLEKIKNDIQYLDTFGTAKLASEMRKETFTSKLEKQISKPASTVLLDYLHETLLPIHIRSYEIELIYDENNKALVDEDEIIVQHIEAIDEMSDIISKAQYGLDKDRYKQFLTDILTIIGKDGSSMGVKASKSQKMDIVRNFYIKYKYIPQSKMKSEVDTGSRTFEELIENGDAYLQRKVKQEEKELVQKLEKEAKDNINKMRKESLDRIRADDKEITRQSR